MNPFVEDYRTDHNIPPFDKIKVEHILPAVEKGIQIQLKELNAIESNPTPATFANTIEALEKSGQTIGRTAAYFYNLLGSHTNESLNALANKISPRMAAHRDRIFLSQTLYSRIEAIKGSEYDVLGAEQQRMIDELLSRFKQAGVQLTGKSKARLEEINQRLATLSVTYQQNMLAESNATYIHITSESELEGLPDSVVAQGAEMARSEGKATGWMYKATRASMFPFLTYSKNRKRRLELYEGYVNRGANSNEWDNRKIAQETADLRLEKANLLGFRNHASYSLQTTMAKTPERVLNLLDAVWEPALRLAKQEAAELQSIINQSDSPHPLSGGDWRYYSELLRQQKYSVSDAEIKPYFPLEKALLGVFEVCKKLFGLGFEEIKETPLYHADARLFSVHEANGQLIGHLILDYYARPSKRGGAWMSAFQGQSNLLNKKPIIVNVCNFEPPTENQPCLLSAEQIRTLFHEFGHALHGLLSNATYPTLAGTAVPRDYVEFPSQMMENWGLEPSVMKSYSGHIETGEPIPDALLEKLSASLKFNQGFSNTEYCAAAYLDLHWHLQNDASKSADEIEENIIESLGLIPEVGFRYRSGHFSHIFAGGYAAGYYSYLWSAVLDKDAYAFFDKQALFDSDKANKLRELVYSSGNTVDPMTQFVAFRGREPTADALMKSRGLL